MTATGAGPDRASSALRRCSALCGATATAAISRSSRSTTCPTGRARRRAPSATSAAFWEPWKPDEVLRGGNRYFRARREAAPAVPLRRGDTRGGAAGLRARPDPPGKRQGGGRRGGRAAGAQVVRQEPRAHQPRKPDPPPPLPPP